MTFTMNYYHSWSEWCNLWRRKWNGIPIKFETKNIKLGLCNYSDAYIPVTGDITAVNSDKNTNVIFINFAAFTKFIKWTLIKWWTY